MDEYKTLLKEKGYSLNKIGISGGAFDRNIALEALDILKKNKTAILGGDILTKKKDEIKLTSDNWYCLEEDYKNNEEYLQNSWDITIKYINLFKDTKKYIYLFQFVIRD